MLKAPRIVIIGGGPAGLMAAEQLTNAAYAVDLYDAMPSVGRKFLLAGIGGLNLTHSEDFSDFMQRYAQAEQDLLPSLTLFNANTLREWAADLGIETFVGTSGRVFPKAMKAAPLLRAWLLRLKQQGLTIHSRHRWVGWNTNNQLIFATPSHEITVDYDVLILALGGGSWKKLGSDSAWVNLLKARHIAIFPLKPSNCGFICDWSQHLRSHYSGAPLKAVTLRFTDLLGNTETRQGELMITKRGVEGSLVYAFSARLRDMIEAKGKASFYLDLLPQQNLADLERLLANRPKQKSLGNFLKSRLHLDATKSALFFECLPRHEPPSARQIAHLLKALPITLTATTPIDEAISTAGGVSFAAVDEHLMLKALSGVFCAGEMLDWEAPTGGYLLTAVLATGRKAGQGALAFIQNQVPSS
ncbi:TIGR03862 family flavoprotein [Thiolinea disciformis]|uniref:TIGR03862 family flavoprotein n=1 Tax=Thiolinea disciformis TaxID=125614 RepID=UPI0003825275|nr:TIGR03862 family flavoprotein [Thiolinea disciformis]